MNTVVRGKVPLPLSARRSLALRSRCSPDQRAMVWFDAGPCRHLFSPLKVAGKAQGLFGCPFFPFPFLRFLFCRQGNSLFDFPLVARCWGSIEPQKRKMEKEEAKDEGGAELIIDTDMGIDDAAALMLALYHSDKARVRAITTVFGNVRVAQASENVARVLELFPEVNQGPEAIPFFTGAAGPIIGRHEQDKSWPGHGTDGLGDYTSSLPPPSRTASPVHAVNALVDMINRHPNRFTILMLGPMTNLALAVRMDPSIATKVRSIIFMGGTSKGKGNASWTAEYNFLCDPEAAHIVIESFRGIPVNMVSWELTLKYNIPWAWYDLWIKGDEAQTNNEPSSKDGDEKEADPLRQQRRAFMRGITLKFEQLYRKSTNNNNTNKEQEQEEEEFTMCDTLAVAVALNPKMITKAKVYHASVELSGRFCRGQLVVDWYRSGGQGVEPGAPCTFRIISGLDRSAFMSLWEDCL
ncbi:putative uridine nucleosidase 1 isoform X1 [Balamuthia mandrillaris]